MRVLITGASGFVAPYLKNELEQHGFQVFSTAQDEFLQCDLSNSKQTKALIANVRPHSIVHLAGLSQTSESKFSPYEYFRSNVLTTLNVCSAFSALPGEKIFLFVSSGMVYGNNKSQSKGFSESSPVQPESNYARSKLAGECVARMFESNNMAVYVVRPFNHLGVNQSPAFVASAFASRIFQASPRSIISVGDLSASRDFTDVYDIVRAYRLILQKKPSQKLFVLGSGRAVKIEKILKALLKIARKGLTIKINPALSSSRSVPQLKSNPWLARRVLGWEAKIPLIESLTRLYRSFK